MTTPLSSSSSDGQPRDWPGRVGLSPRDSQIAGGVSTQWRMPEALVRFCPRYLDMPAASSCTRSVTKVIQDLHDALTLILCQQFERAGSAEPDRAAYEPGSGFVLTAAQSPWFPPTEPSSNHVHPTQRARNQRDLHSLRSTTRPSYLQPIPRIQTRCSQSGRRRIHPGDPCQPGCPEDFLWRGCV
ncbi:hypothetical protein HDG35_003894 [Paraburkholderia sp. JPY681]|nr:hypothetical protein [Paraburkholderia atlantica]